MIEGGGFKYVAICGKLRSGKSTASDYLETEYGFQRVSFGNALKRYADEIFPHFTEVISKPCPFGGRQIINRRKPRRLYQQFGQLMRDIDPNIWIYHAEKSISVWENMRDVNGIVIDDLRQPNEFEWCKANGFTVIRINANEDTRLERARALGDSFKIEDLRHDTELHIDDFEADYDVWNDDIDSDELARKLDEIMKDLRK